MPDVMPFSAETPTNYDTRCLCVLVLDTSTSMNGSPINELNRGLMDFGEMLRNSSDTRYTVETSIITFNSTVVCIQEPKLVDDMDQTNKFPLTVEGSTRLVDGVRAAIKKVEDRKDWYRRNNLPYYRPWIVLITDGYPDPGQDITGLAAEIREGHTQNKFAFLPMGVEGADERVLTRISTPEFPPIPIDWKKFKEVFDWLTNSLGAISKSADGKNVTFDSPESFMRSGWGGGDFTQSTL